ncbi:hypothetical protein Ae201684P_017825 [Aphanomyces euteiches]|uniref:Uncharacterized protein n=1 Tax=Aphanomyces euteiches TaxID=100861 RepID=A0A6G0XMP7_9STRA|nr:hypothetical protein Ae201684_003163 [Aphanomyces euteiches]KAH9098613.1 hypothetical protein Ae201684P_017825 [Aphanomyces euteiches]KAH9152762.1 hypothetical protein AeRB84_004861 [Aphanomyces euteiches]
MTATMTFMDFTKYIEDLQDPTEASETCVSISSTKEIYRVYVMLIRDVSMLSYSSAGIYLEERTQAQDKSIVLTYNMQCDRPDKMGKTVLIALKMITSSFSFSARALAATQTITLVPNVRG